MKVLENKQLHHLGIVAGVCNEIGLIETIDRHILKSKRKVSVGEAVQALRSSISNEAAPKSRFISHPPERYHRSITTSVRGWAIVDPPFVLMGLPLSLSPAGAGDDSAVGSTHCWAALLKQETDTRHEPGKCGAKRWTLPTYRL